MEALGAIDPTSQDMPGGIIIFDNGNGNAHVCLDSSRIYAYCIVLNTEDKLDVAANCVLLVGRRQRDDKTDAAALPGSTSDFATAANFAHALFHIVKPETLSTPGGQLG